MTNRILLGTRKGTFVVDQSTGTYRARLLGHAGVGVNYVVRDPNSSSIWAALGHGHWGAKLSVSKDEGVTWHDAPHIKYPDGARYLDGFDPETGESAKIAKYKPATLLKLWTIAFGAPGQIYVGTIPGGLFMSQDDGASFELNRPLWNHESRGGDLFSGAGTGVTHWFGTPASDGEFAAGIHSIEVDPRNPKRILVAVSTAGVLESLDGGATWSGKNKGMLNDYLPDPVADWGHDPHLIALCKGAPDSIWQQNHCGVFYSENGSASWTRVSAKEQGIHFGFPISSDAKDGKTAWVVPGKSDNQRTTIDGALFVGRTEDGGKTWTQLRQGLPQDAYDVVYRHALDSLGGCVCFGSTTGNVYLSEDRGENWICISNNLPPIYSVRFE